MGVLAATVRFAAPVPSSPDLVAALSRHVGEPIRYEEASCKLTCPALKDAGIILATADPQESVWELRTGYLDGNYFWYAILVVMEKLGGVQVGFNGEDMPLMPAPSWAYQPWQFAKTGYGWRKWRKTTWLTLAEARRLGIIK